MFEVKKIKPKLWGHPEQAGATLTEVKTHGK